MARQVFEYCNEEIKYINVILISSEEIVPIRSMLDSQFSNVRTLLGTRSFHQFIPLSESIIGANCVSEHASHAIKLSLVLGKTNLVKFIDPNVSNFVNCSYEKHWVGLVSMVDNDYVQKSNSCTPATQQDPPSCQGKMMYALYHLYMSNSCTSATQQDPSLVKER